MIIKLIFSPIFALITFIINLIPEGFNLPGWGLEFISVVNSGLAFFPVPVFLIIVGNVSFWMLIHFNWAVVEWVYKKIPGVN